MTHRMGWEHQRNRSGGRAADSAAQGDHVGVALWNTEELFNSCKSWGMNLHFSLVLDLVTKSRERERAVLDTVSENVTIYIDRGKCIDCICI